MGVCPEQRETIYCGLSCLLAAGYQSFLQTSIQSCTLKSVWCNFLSLTWHNNGPVWLTRRTKCRALAQKVTEFFLASVMLTLDDLRRGEGWFGPQWVTGWAWRAGFWKTWKGNIRAALPSKIMKLKAPKADLKSDLKLHLYVRSQAYWKLTP